MKNIFGLVNAIIDPETPIRAFIGRSMHIFENVSYNDYNKFYLNDARVTLFEDNREIGTLTRPENSAGQYVIDYKPQKGKVYRLDVTHSIYNAASAETLIPMPIPINKVDTMTRRVTESFGYSYDMLNLSIEVDDPEGENYYMVDVFSAFEFTYYNPDTESDTTVVTIGRMSISSDDAASDGYAWEVGGLSGITFSDKIFDGKKYAFKVGLGGYMRMYEDQIIIIHLRSLTPSLYKYMRSYQAQQEASWLFFAEAVSVFTNIENGYGIMGGYSTAKYSFMIPGTGDIIKD